MTGTFKGSSEENEVEGAAQIKLEDGKLSIGLETKDGEKIDPHAPNADKTKPGNFDQKGMTDNIGKNTERVDGNKPRDMSTKGSREKRQGVEKEKAILKEQMEKNESIKIDKLKAADSERKDKSKKREESVNQEKH